MIAWTTLWADAASIRQRLLLTLEDAYGLDWNCAVVTRPGFDVRASLQQWLAWTATYETRLAFALETGEAHDRGQSDGRVEDLRVSN